MPRKRPRFRLCCLILAMFLLIATGLRAEIPVPDPQLLTAENYVADVEYALAHAEYSIDVVMYLIQLQKESASNPVYRLLQALAAAHGRGCSVRVIMEGSHRTQNLAAYNFLNKNGVEAYFDTNAKFIHEKTIVIDGDRVIIGSQNWSDVSLISNLEKAIMIEDKSLAQKSLAEIDKIEILKKFEPVKGVLLPCEFFYTEVRVTSSACSAKTHPGPGAQLLTRNAERAFDLYLFLRRECTIRQTNELTPDWEFWARYLGYDREQLSTKNTDYYEAYYRVVIQGQLRFLAKLGLIHKERWRSITLNVPSTANAIIIPDSYWDYGWDHRLSLRAKYAYLINLVELKRSYDLPSWYRSQKDIGRIYGIHPDTFGKGAVDLARWNLIEIQSDLASPDGPYSERLANYYTINPLYQTSDFEQAFNQLNKKYDIAIVKEARLLATDLNEPYDLKVIETFVKLIEKHGLAAVKKANGQTAGLRQNNAKRNLQNTIALLKKSS